MLYSVIMLFKMLILPHYWVHDLVGPELQVPRLACSWRQLEHKSILSVLAELTELILGSIHGVRDNRQKMWAGIQFMIA